MPKPISTMRVAFSFLTPNGAETISQEMDFDLGVGQGLEIFGVLGTLQDLQDSSLAAADDDVSAIVTGQSLHLETGALEDPLGAAGEDIVRTDTEIIYRQDALLVFMNQVTAGSAVSLSVTPSGLVTFPIPILTARNPQHRAEGRVTDQFSAWSLLMYYRYVELNDDETVFLLSRSR